MIICPITEGFEWPGYNLIINSKGKGPRFIGQIAVIPTNFTDTKLFSLSLENL